MESLFYHSSTYYSLRRRTVRQFWRGVQRPPILQINQKASYLQGPCVPKSIMWGFWTFWTLKLTNFETRFNYSRAFTWYLQRHHVAGVMSHVQKLVPKFVNFKLQKVQKTSQDSFSTLSTLFHSITHFILFYSAKMGLRLTVLKGLPETPELKSCVKMRSESNFKKWGPLKSLKTVFCEQIANTLGPSIWRPYMYDPWLKQIYKDFNLLLDHPF